MVKPDKVPSFVRQLAAEARKQGWTAYRISKEAMIPVATATRLLAGDLNPTAATCDAIAKALGLAIEVRKA